MKSKKMSNLEKLQMIKNEAGYLERQAQEKDT